MKLPLVFTEGLCCFSTQSIHSSQLDSASLPFVLPDIQNRVDIMRMATQVEGKGQESDPCTGKQGGLG